MHELLFHRQKALEDEDLRTYAEEIGLELERFERDRKGDDVSARIARDVASGEATGVVRGTPTLFIDGVLYEGSYDSGTLLEAVGR
jgi:protein-disulfide isomerase